MVFDSISIDFLLSHPTIQKYLINTELVIIHIIEWGIVIIVIWLLIPQTIRHAFRYSIWNIRAFFRDIHGFLGGIFRIVMWLFRLPFLPVFLIATCITRCTPNASHIGERKLFFFCMHLITALMTKIFINPVLIVSTILALIVQIVALILSFLIGKQAVYKTSSWVYWSLIQLKRLLSDYVPMWLLNLCGHNIIRHMGGIKHMERGVYILGKSGFGKSTLLKILIWHFIVVKRYGLMLLEPHGELVSEVLSMNCFKENHKSKARERLVVLDLEDRDNPTPNNIFNVPLPKHDAARNAEIDNLVQAYVQSFQSVYTILGQPLTGGMDEILENLFYWALDLTDHNREDRHILTLIDVGNALASEEKIDPKYIRLFRKVRNPVVRNFFEQVYFDTASKKSKGALRKRLNRLLRQHAFRKSFGHPDNAIQHALILLLGNILVVKASKGVVGAAVSLLTHMMANTQMYYASHARLHKESTHKRIKFFCLLDEAHNVVVDPNLETGINELRKCDVHFVIAHQLLNQGKISPSIQKAFKSLNIKICFALEDTDSTEMARVLDIKGKDAALRNLDIGECFVKTGKRKASWVKIGKKFAFHKIGTVKHPIYMLDTDRAELDHYLRQKRLMTLPPVPEEPKTQDPTKQVAELREDATHTQYELDTFDIQIR